MPWGRRAGIADDEFEQRLTVFRLDGLIATGQLTEASTGHSTPRHSASTRPGPTTSWSPCGLVLRRARPGAVRLRRQPATGVHDRHHQQLRRRRPPRGGQARYGFEQLVDEIVYSHEVGLAKPDPRIYALACDRLGVEPAELVFVDDVAMIVDSANRFGLQAVLHTGDSARTIAEVRALLARSAAPDGWPPSAPTRDGETGLVGEHHELGSVPRLTA